MPKLRLLLGDDHTLVRQRLLKILEERPEWEVVSEVGDGRAAVQEAIVRRPDVAIIDIGMPLFNGVDATQQIVRNAPGTRVLILSMHSEEAYVARALQAGATRAVSAHQIGGLRMAAALLRPSVVEFVELTRPLVGEEVDLEEVRIAPGSSSIGLTVRALEQRAPRLRVVGLKRAYARMQLVPGEDVAIAAGDLLVVIGERASVEQIARIAAPG